MMQFAYASVTQAIEIFPVLGGGGGGYFYYQKRMGGGGGGPLDPSLTLSALALTHSNLQITSSIVPMIHIFLV